MPCYHPLHAFRDSERIRFVARGELHNLKLPCGQCRGCRLERSRQWAIRCMHEATLHKHNCFLTVTYATEHLPPHGNLRKRDHQLLLKRLRKAAIKGDGIVSQYQVDPEHVHAAPLRYYMCGEYGEQLQRPHYHFCIFGLDFSDKKYWSKTPAGSKIFRSATLEKLWPYGHSTVGDLTFESAAYTARYVMKKINGQQKQKHYEKINIETGEIIKIEPEYNEMSRATGIGKKWIEKYKSDVYDALPGQVIVRGKQSNAPRYYDKQLKLTDPAKYEIILQTRETEGRKHRVDQTPARLKVREQVAEATMSKLKRNI